MKILNFGSCNIDYVYGLPHITRPGETLSAYDMNVFSGGKGLNQSVAAARAGGSVYHAGFTGCDGQFLRDVLFENSVDISYLQRAEVNNGHAIIQVDGGGENCIFIHKGTNGMLTEELIDGVLSDFGAGDILILQNETNLVHYIVDRAHAVGMTTVFNPSPFTDDLKDLDYSKISYLIVNETEARSILGRESIDDLAHEMLALYPDIRLVMTLGGRGCVYADKTGRVSQNAFKVKAVDTTGAGDTFTGYFVAMTAAGATPDVAVKYACAAAALSVTKNGAAPSIPVMADVERFLANNNT